MQVKLVALLALAAALLSAAAAQSREWRPKFEAAPSSGDDSVVEEAARSEAPPAGSSGGAGSAHDPDDRAACWPGRARGEPLPHIPQVSAIRGRTLADVTPRQGCLEELTVDELPTSREFYDKYDRPMRPVIFRGLNKGQVALDFFAKDENLLKAAEMEKVAYERLKEEVRGDNTFTTTMRDFLNHYKTKDIYAVTAVPELLLDDCYLPSFLHCGGYINSINMFLMWFSNGGTHSVLHSDTYGNVNCVYSGYKRFMMFDLDQTDAFDKDETLKFAEGFHKINVTVVDPAVERAMQDHPYTEAWLEPGDCLFIPPLVRHQVVSTGRSLAINTWWTPLTEYRAERCGLPDEDEEHHLVKRRYLPKEGQSSERISLIEIAPFGLEPLSFKLMEMVAKANRNFRLPLHAFLSSLRELDLTDEGMEIAEEAFHLMDTNSDYMLSMVEALKGISPHVPNPTGIDQPLGDNNITPKCQKSIIRCLMDGDLYQNEPAHLLNSIIVRNPSKMASFSPEDFSS